MKIERVIIIRDKTRLEQLIERFNSKAQAKFYIEKSGGEFESFEHEHLIFYESLSVVQKAISRYSKFKIIYRSFLPTYIFTKKDLVLVIGQDGLLANTAKYVEGLPILGVNPDIERYDGVLLKHMPNQLVDVIRNTLNSNFNTQEITMAKVTLNDGQFLLAFNDFYVGANSHVSSRYTIEYNGKREMQSSSGIIISTGAGSTGWLSSIYNMVSNISKNDNNLNLKTAPKWDDDKLVFVVREPFLSKTSQTRLGYGIITSDNKLKIESNMSMKGVIFSDGIESDFLNFNSGTIAEIGLAKEKANLII